MAGDVEAASALYAAMNDRNPQRIRDALCEDFVGVVTAGMPFGAGRHTGRQAMLEEVWGPVFMAYDVRVEVDRYLDAGGGTVVAIGFYTGHERDGNRPFDARFAHVVEVRDGRIAKLEQITDSASWIGP